MQLELNALLLHITPDFKMLVHFILSIISP